MLLLVTMLPLRLKNFFAFYVLAFLLHYTEEWDHPVTVCVFMVLAIIAWSLNFRPITILVFSLAAHVQIFAFQFPDLANHLRVFIGCNLAVTLFSAALVFGRGTPDYNRKILAGLAPTLMLALVVTYLYAGFHKLNWGFFDPEYSCAMNFVDRILYAFWLGDWEIPPAFFPWAVGFVYVWELCIPFLLLFKRTQLVALPICLLMHWLLSPTGFLDFASLAWAILILFFNEGYHDAIEKRPVCIAKRSIPRRTLCFWLTILGGLIAWLYLEAETLTFLENLPRHVETLTGLLFVGCAVFFLWPVFGKMGQERGFEGIALGWRKIHWIYAIPLLFVFLNGFQPYLGLSTGGAYSMFSNLRTEGPRSNHLLLGSNPFKVFSFQEDVVEVYYSPSRVRDHGRNIQGYDVPMVEFRKMLHKWRQSDRKVPILLLYRGKRYESPDITQHPDFQDNLHWYDHFLDFRIIPRDRPNACQW